MAGGKGGGAALVLHPDSEDDVDDWNESDEDDDYVEVAAAESSSASTSTSSLATRVITKGACVGGGWEAMDGLECLATKGGCVSCRGWQWMCSNVWVQDGYGTREATRKPSRDEG